MLIVILFTSQYEGTIFYLTQILIQSGMKLFVTVICKGVLCYLLAAPLRVGNFLFPVCDLLYSCEVQSVLSPSSCSCVNSFQTMKSLSMDFSFVELQVNPSQILGYKFFLPVRREKRSRDQAGIEIHLSGAAFALTLVISVSGFCVVELWLLQLRESGVLRTHLMKIELRAGVFRFCISIKEFVNRTFLKW